MVVLHDEVYMCLAVMQLAVVLMSVDLLLRQLVTFLINYNLYTICCILFGRLLLQ